MNFQSWQLNLIILKTEAGSVISRQMSPFRKGQTDHGNSNAPSPSSSIVYMSTTCVIDQNNDRVQ